MFIRFTWVLSFLALTAGLQAQVKRVKEQPQQSQNKTLSVRARAFIEGSKQQTSQAQWSRVIYREIDLTKGGNASLYYPEEVMPDQTNLFRLIMDELVAGNLAAYEYLDGRELFTPEFKLDPKAVLDRFHILYEEKRSPLGKPSFSINPSDVPCHEVLSYYVIERWVFDQRGSKFFAYIEAICPILHREGEFGGDVTKYPMFWIDYTSVRPALTQHLILSDGVNNALRYTMDDFFALRQYEGEIFKTRNLRNQSLMQQYPHADSLKLAQERIENELSSFEKALWVPRPADPQPTASTEEKKDNKTEALVAETEDEEAKPARTARSNPRSSSSRSKAEKETSQATKQSEAPRPVRSVRRTR